MSHVTTHVLDSALGRPAVGVAVALDARTAPEADWQPLAEGVTNDDGRVADFGPDALPVGDYRVRFATGAYFAATGQKGFYPEVSVTFTLAEPDSHYHIPLLLSPFAYSTYRGS